MKQLNIVNAPDRLEIVSKFLAYGGEPVEFELEGGAKFSMVISAIAREDGSGRNLIIDGRVISGALMDRGSQRDVGVFIDTKSGSGFVKNKPSLVWNKD